MTRARDLARLGNQNIITADSNFNVGIGSLTPDAKLDVVGVISATSFYGDGSGLTGVASTDNINTSTLATFTGGVDISGNSSVSVTGVVTATSFSGNLTGNVTGNATGLSGTPNLNVGIVTATSFEGSGSGLTGLNIPAGFTELDAALFN